MELEQYLTSRIKNKKSIKKLPKSKSFRQIARRGRGFGRARNVRHKDYKNTKDDINMKILMLLDKLLGKDEKVDKVMKQNEEDIKKPLLMLKDGKLEEDPDRQSPDINIVENEQLKIEIGNHLRDYKTKWEHILDQQNDLLEGLGDVSKGKMGEETLLHFQQGNQRVKDEIIGLQFDLQTELNEASDVNDYKEFITFQQEVFTKAIPQFVEVDNRIMNELKSNIEEVQEYDIDLQQREDELEQQKEGLGSLQEAQLKDEKNLLKAQRLRKNLKIERQKTKTLEEQVLALEQQTERIRNEQFQQSRQILLERQRQQGEEPELTEESEERDI
tara:strand:+ start:4060 stop:5049 length:990 start_codon:yes stop_codon:yes gene_type:complete